MRAPVTYSSSRTGLASWQLMALLAWAVAIYAVLQVAKLEGLIGHSICGAGGCGPPGEALLAYHGFWAVLIWPIVAILAVRASPNLARQIGWGLLSIGSLTLVGIGTWAAINWLETAGSQHIVQRSLFVLITTIDMPALQITMAGLICLQVARHQLKQTPHDLPPPLRAASVENQATP